MKKVDDLLREFAVPLFLGMIVSMVMAQVNYDYYLSIIHFSGFGDGWKFFGHDVDLKFLVNDIGMVFFFGIATKEIVESMLPGGALHSPRQAANPLFATVGGVLGPAFLYIALTLLVFGNSMDYKTIANGWGIPTATDIALAGCIARIIFGANHPAVTFLLLLAIVDDAIGLVIIAVFYPDPNHPVQPVFLALTILGMGLAYIMARFRIRHWVWYVAVAGSLSWFGLFLAYLHPALALVAVVPFMPKPHHDTGLFESKDEADLHLVEDITHHATLENYERGTKTWVDYGLFFFTFANAGVPLQEINGLTWIVLASLIIGKVVGISAFSLLACRLGFPLPQGMDVPCLLVVGLLGGLGLTVALFVTGQALPEGVWQNGAKMGAVFSGGIVLLVPVLKYFLRGSTTRSLAFR